MLKSMYVEFKCWAEGKVDVPWLFVIFEETNDYRSRRDLRVKINQKTIQSTFLSFNQETVKTFFDQNINAIILGLQLSAVSNDDMINQLQKVFGYCEILGSCEVNAENHLQIASILAGAGLSAPAGS